MLGDRLKSRMELFGYPGCPDTMKCLMTAAEKGVDIDAKYVDASDGGANDADFRAISPFGSLPVLRDVKFVVYGTPAIMSYLDDKGFGQCLVPRNGVTRAQQYQWIHVATEYVGPHITPLMQGSGDAETAKQAIGVAFDALETQLAAPKRGDFIVGDFSLADIHWGAYAHACELAGFDTLIGSRPEVKAWWSRIKSHPSTSKEPVVAYEVLPTRDDIEHKQLKSILINT